MTAQSQAVQTHTIVEYLLQTLCNKRQGQPAQTKKGAERRPSFLLIILLFTMKEIFIDTKKLI
jgi:hypothetical protein